MRKKSMYALSALMMITTIFVTSCTKEYDDSELRGRIENLEAWQETVNSDIESLKTLVSNLENKDYVTSIKPLSDGTGYVLNFEKSGNVTIKNGTNGLNGNDGHSPKISVKQDTDGKYYWTMDDQWIENEKGEKIPTTGEKGADGNDGIDGNDGADAIAPKVRINSKTNMWEISTDDGIKWESTGVKATGNKGNTGAQGAQGAQGDAIFKKDGIDNTNSNYVILTLANGTEITLPKINPITIGFTEYEGVTIDAFYKEIAIKLPETLKESDYTSIIASVETTTGDGMDIATRSDSNNNWDVKITKPTFTGDVCNNDAKVSITAPARTVNDTKGILTVSLVCKNGERISSSVTFTYTALHSTANNVMDSLRRKYDSDMYKLTDLVVFGELNSEDIKILNSLSFAKLRNLDLSNATIVGDIINDADGDIVSGEATIPAWGFKNSMLETIILPDNFTLLNYCAFSNAKNLKYIEIPANVKTIGRMAFQGCENLKTIKLNEGLTTLASSAFYECGVESITLPSTVIEIPDWTFGQCKNLKTIKLNEGITNIGQYAFYECGVESITIPSTVTEIQDRVFENCENLKNTNFAPNSLLTRIGLGAFVDCHELISINIPEGVTTLGDGAFGRCEKLSRVTLPSSLKEMGIAVFQSCHKLTEITIPANVTNIDNKAFQYCGALKKVIVLATTPPSLDDTIGFNVNYHFDKGGVAIETILYVPAANIDAYNGSDWNNSSFFKSIKAL